MGNQLAGTVPTQILPVEHYFQEIPDFQYVSSLGSTRFLKVALAKHKETYVVIKVFVHHDPTLPLENYKEKLDVLSKELSPDRNCLPYSQTLVFDKAVFLSRQYIKSNCYDRLSTRPFLTLLEKKWIAFQLLKALQYCHSKGLCHGDIKLENILVTSWLWLLLTDFASFKPAFLPEDNPADFSYFFDTSRRRTCYIAPERFQKTPVSSEGMLPINQSMVLDTSQSPSQLTPAMDIFAAGCSLIELFAEGQAPFDLAQLLAYRTPEIAVTPILEKIEDRDIKDFLLSMIALDPSERKTAEHYLQEQRGNIFPDSYYSYLYDYMRVLTQPQWGPSDPKIDKMHRDLPELIERLKTDGALLLIANIVLSSLRSLQYSSSKLKALEILTQIYPYLTDEILLDRFLPFIVHLMMDAHSAVRSCALKVLTSVLRSIQYLSRGDATVFTEYILPAIASRVQDESVLVRSTVAQHMADLAEIAQKFLELSHWRIEHQIATPTTEHPCSAMNPHGRSFEVELQTLQESFQSLVACLLTDSESQVRRTLLEYSVTRLCVFFGRPKASDVIFSHVITFLNDKNDRHLRGSFFESLAGVVSYIGWVCAPICQPLLQQGLTDVEEYVTVKAIESMFALTQTGLLPKSALLSLLRDTVPYLLHPNRWIRFATVGFVCCASRHLDPVDVKCRLSAIVDPFLSYRIPLEKSHIVFDALHPPIPRVIWDSVIRCADINLLLSTLAERHHSKKSGQEWIPHPAEIGGPIKNLLRRLDSEGLTSGIAEQLLRMKDHLLKLRGHRQALEFNQQPWSDQAVVHLASLKMLPNQLRSTEIPKGLFSRFPHLDAHQLTKSDFPIKTDDTIGSATMNPEWQHMFGLPPPGNADQDKREFESAEILRPEEEKSSRLAFNTLPCNGELNRLITHRSIEERSIAATRRAVASGIEGRAFTVKSLDWSPKGMLLSHLHEHRAAVTKLTNLGKSTLFASASVDASIKIWDCGRLESRSIANRSRQTYRADSGITSLISLQSGGCLACATTKGAIQIIRLETGHVVSRSPAKSKQIDLNQQGSIADLQPLNCGNQSVLIYATVMGSIACWDFRCPEPAWEVDHCLKNGIITSMCVDPSQTWFGVGTDIGAHICWDLRFRLPVSCVYHRSGSRVLRLLSHPANSSQFVSAVENNNEVSLWNWENQSQSMAVWASASPPLTSRTTAGPNSYAAFIGCRTAYQNQPFLLTGGSDLKLRFWDLVHAEQSFVFSNGACDPDRIAPTAEVSYRSSTVDGVDVIHEVRHPIASHMASPRGQHAQNPLNATYNTSDGKSSNPIGVTVTDYNPPFGHADVISDITMIEGAQPYIVSGSKDGVIKVWM